MMTKLRSGQGKQDDTNDTYDDDADDDDAAEQRNTYMSPSQATQQNVTNASEGALTPNLKKMSNLQSKVNNIIVENYPDKFQV